MSEVSPPAQSTLAKKLLAVTSLMFAIWIAALIAMYATTVYPQRHATTAPVTAR